MAGLKELPFKYRLLIKAYPWRRVNPVPWTPLKKKLEECRLVLVSSAGIITEDQKPFDNTIRGGDPSIREIPVDVETASLMETHRSKVFDHSGIHEDLNLAFPIDRLRELARSGRIGSLNHRHISLMGSVSAPGRLIKKTIPLVAPQLVADGVDVALLIPV